MIDLMVKYEKQCKLKVKELRIHDHINYKYQSFSLLASWTQISTNEFKLNGFHHVLIDWLN